MLEKPVMPIPPLPTYLVMHLSFFSELSVLFYLGTYSMWIAVLDVLYEWIRLLERCEDGKNLPPASYEQFVKMWKWG